MGGQDAVSCNTEDTNPRADEALQLWEQGAAKEQAGSLMDAINFYRKALKVHDGVEKLYRKKLQEDYMLQQKLEALNLMIRAMIILKIPAMSMVQVRKQGL